MDYIDAGLIGLVSVLAASFVPWAKVIGMFRAAPSLADDRVTKITKVLEVIDMCEDCGFDPKDLSELILAIARAKK